MKFTDFQEDSFGFSRDWAALRISRQSLDMDLKPFKPLGDSVGGMLLNESVASHQVVDGILMYDHLKVGMLNGGYRKAEKVILVCDNLNTHTKGAFYEAFTPDVARSLVKRLEFRYAQTRKLAQCRRE